MIEENIRIIRLIFILPLCIFLFQCNPGQKKIPTAKKGVLATPLIIKNTTENKFLSQYGFFEGELADLKPNKDVFPYTLNTPLFSNYAYKKNSGISSIFYNYLILNMYQSKYDDKK